MVQWCGLLIPRKGGKKSGKVQILAKNVNPSLPKRDWKSQSYITFQREREREIERERERERERFNQDVRE